MNPTERDLIERLFTKVGQAAAQPTPRDLEAEQFIYYNMQRIPGAPYYMAQTMIAQRFALKQAEARIAELEQRMGIMPGSPHSFLAPHQPSYPPHYSHYQQGYYPQSYGQPSSGSGFLATAGATALGVAGGLVLGAIAFEVIDEIGDALFDAPVEAATNAFDEPVESGGFFDGGNGGDWGGGDW